MKVAKAKRLMWRRYRFDDRCLKLRAMPGGWGTARAVGRWIISKRSWANAFVEVGPPCE